MERHHHRSVRCTLLAGITLWGESLGCDPLWETVTSEVLTFSRRMFCCEEEGKLQHQCVLNGLHGSVNRGSQYTAAIIRKAKDHQSEGKAALFTWVQNPDGISFEEPKFHICVLQNSFLWLHNIKVITLLSCHHMLSLKGGEKRKLKCNKRNR